MLSVVILTKNEEKNIIDCLETVLWADEIIIVDDFSTDRTVEIINSLNDKKIKVYKRELNDNFAEQRNFGLTKVTKKWVLFLDADERVTDELHEEINSIVINISNNPMSGYYIKRKDVMWKKLLKHGEVGNISLLRFGKRGEGIWLGKVHEAWQIDGKTSMMDSSILHYPHPTVGEFLKKINYYSTLRAKELFERHEKPSTVNIILYPTGKFFQNYILRLGFLDGIPGLVFAIMMSFHSFLVRAKLWTYESKA